MITSSNLELYLDEYLLTRDPRTVSAADALQALQERDEIRIQDAETEIMKYLNRLHIHASRGIRSDRPRPTRLFRTECERFNAERKDMLHKKISATFEDLHSKLNSGEREFKRLKKCKLQEDPKDLSNAMVKFFGTEERQMTPSRAKERVWLYITKNNLDDGIDVKCDWKLEKLFGRSSFTKDDIPGLVRQHFLMP